MSMDIRQTMLKTLHTAMLNVRATTKNRYWDEFVEHMGVLGDWLEDRENQEAKACRADWRIEWDRGEMRRMPKQRWVPWMVTIPEGVNVQPFLTAVGKEREVIASLTPSDFRISGPNVRAAISVGESTVTVERQVRYTVVNTDWFLCFAPFTLKIVGWSRASGARRRMLFTWVEHRAVKGIEANGPTKKDIDITPGGFVSLFQTPAAPPPPEIPLYESR